MGRSAEEYKKLLKSLLPPGKAITKDPDSVIDQLLLSVSDELSRVDGRSYDLLKERDPRRAVELITEHEKDYGITEPETVLADRQAAVFARQIAVGGQYKNYFIEIAGAINYTIYIYEFIPFIAGVSRAGDACGGLDNLFFFLVRSDAQGDKKSFGTGFSNGFDMMLSMDPSWSQTRNALLRALINKIDELKPAHMMALYDYYGVGFDRGFSAGFNAIPVNDDTIPIVGFDEGFDIGFNAMHEYNGEYLIGGFDHGFDLSFDTHNGSSFEPDGFSDGFF